MKTDIIKAKVNKIFKEVKGNMIREWEFLNGDKVTDGNIGEAIKDTVWSATNVIYYKNNFLKNESNDVITEVLEGLEKELLQFFLKEDC